MAYGLLLKAYEKGTKGTLTALLGSAYGLWLMAYGNGLWPLAW